MKCLIKRILVVVAFLMWGTAWSQPDVRGVAPVEILNLSVMPDPVIDGDLLTITFDIENSAGPLSMTDVSGFFMTFSGDLDPASQPVAGGGTCNAQSPGMFVCNYPTLASGTTTVTATARITATSTPPYFEQLDVDCNVSGIGGCQTAGQTTFQVTAGPTESTLSVMATGPTAVETGSQFNYSITITNFDDPGNPNDGADPIAPGFDFLSAGSPDSPLFVVSSGANWTCLSDPARGPFSASDSCTYNAPLPLGATSTPLAITLDAPLNPSMITSDFTPAAINLGAGSTDDQIITVVQLPAADLGVVKTTSTPSIVEGQNADYLITVTNFGPAQATNVKVVDTLPPGMNFVSAGGAGWTCVPDTPGTGQFECTFAGPLGMPNPAPVDSIINVQTLATAPGTLNNQVMVMSDNDSAPGNDVSNVDVNVAPAADLALTKTPDVSSQTAGNPINYTFNVLNNGPSMATAFTVNDDLPPELSFSGFNAPGGDFNCTDVGGSVSCVYTGSGLANGVSTDVTITTNAINVGTAMNTATVVLTGPEQDLVPSNNTDSASVIIDPAPLSADLMMSKTASVTTAIVGSNFDYTLTVTNNGPDANGQIQFQDTLPAEVTVVNTSSPNFICNSLPPNFLNCLYGGAPLAMGQSASVTVTVSADAVASTTNVVALQIPPKTAIPDPNPNNDSASVDVNIVAPAPMTDLSADVTGPTSVTVGQSFTFDMTVTNNGPDTATQFSLLNDLPPELLIQSFTAPPDFICSDQQTRGLPFTCDYIGNGLASGQSLLVSLVVIASEVGTFINPVEANVGQGNVDPNSANNNDTATVNVVAPSFVADLSGAPNPVEPGMDQTLTLSLNNTSNVDLVNLTAEITFPPGYQLGAGSPLRGGGWSCAPDSSTQIFCNNPNIPAGANSSVDFVVTVPTVEDTYQVSVNLLGNPGVDESFVRNFVVTSGENEFVDMAISKSAPTSIPIGATFDYNLQVANLGTIPADNVFVLDTLPQEVIFQRVVGLDWSCSESQGQLACDFIAGNFPAGGQSSLSITVINSQTPAQFTNTAEVGTSSTDIDSSNNVDSVTVDAFRPARPDLILDKSTSQTEVEPGALVSFDLSMVNNGLANAIDVNLVDTLPDGSSFAGFSGTGWTCQAQGNEVICDLGPTLLPGASSSLKIDIFAPQTPGMAINTAVVLPGDRIDANPSDNQDSASFAVVGISPDARADLSISKSADRAMASPGDSLNYDISVVNLGPDASDQVVVTDLLPSEFMLDNIVAGGWSCQVTQNNIVCELMGPLDANQSASISLTGTLGSIDSDVVNNVSVSSAVTDPVSSNNTAQAVVRPNPVAAPVDLNLTVTDEPDPVLTGNNYRYQATILNEGPAVAENVQLLATLPEQVQLVSANAQNGSCDTSQAPLVKCDFASISLQGVRIVNIDVTAPAEQQMLTASFSVSSPAVDSDPSDNEVQEQTSVRETPEEGDLGGRLMDTLGGMDVPAVRDNLMPVANLCDSPPPDLIPWCRQLSDALDEGDGPQAANFIEGIVGRQGLSQHTSLVEAGQALGQNVASRLTQVRGGAGSGLNLSGLNLRYGNEALSLGLLQSAIEDDASPTTTGDFVKPWGFFVNGTISAGERDPGTSEISFDFDTYGITAGFDYRFSNKSVAGIAVGYSKFDSDFSDGSVLDTDGWDITAFGSFTPFESFYLDGRIGYGNVDFTQNRVVQFQLRNLEIDDIARGSTDAGILSGAISLGYNWSKHGWNINPSIGLSFLDGEIDGFQETGSIFALEFDDQDVDSFIQSASISVSKPISLSRGVLSPQFDFSYYHESSNDDNNLVTRIVGTGASFLLENDQPDTKYGSAGLGLVFVTSNGKQAYLSYRQILGLSGFDRWTVNAGFRFEF